MSRGDCHAHANGRGHGTRPTEAEEERRQAVSAQRQTPLSCGNRRGTNRRAKPGRKPGDRYAVDSYRRAIDRGVESAFPPPGDLAKWADETQKEYRARLTKKQAAEVKEWRRSHQWHPHQLRHNYATNFRREFGLEAAQVLLGHTKADVTQIHAERDMSRAAAVAARIG
jgi:integrase